MFDAVVLGGGAAGMACALRLRDAGRTAAVVEREPHLGGILMQCIHNGFGLHRFGEELTGPEYAERFARQVEERDVACYRESTALGVQKRGGAWSVEIASPVHGVQELHARSVVFANGCRERNRGNIGIAGGRPAGVMTAGLAQRLLNIDGYIPGRSAVIVGSGDIGLIMARRLTWAGVEVKAVVEIMPYPAGLPRNLCQCLEDFEIPLHLSHAVTRIHGAGRVTGVTVTPLENGRARTQDAFDLACDTVLLSVGLIPQTTLLKKMGAGLNPSTGGALVDATYMTELPGVFSCGNALHVHDLVDYVSQEAERCADAAHRWLDGGAPAMDAEVVAGANVRYVVPGRVKRGSEVACYFRPVRPMREAVVRLREGNTVLAEKQRAVVRPSEMETFTVAAADWDVLSASANAANAAQAGRESLTLEILEAACIPAAGNGGTV